MRFIADAMLGKMGRWLRMLGYDTIICNNKISDDEINRNSGVLKEENEEVVKKFLQRHPEFTVENPRGFLPPGISPHFTPEGYLFAFPPEAKTDGFFAVRLKKRP